MTLFYQYLLLGGELTMERTKVVIPQFSIELPEGVELIATEDRDRLEADQQITWDLNKASQVTGLTKSDLSTVLQKFKQQLDIDNGGCVFYPYNGGKFCIESLGFIQFIRNNFARIMGVLKK